MSWQSESHVADTPFGGAHYESHYVDHWMMNCSLAATGTDISLRMFESRQANEMEMRLWSNALSRPW